VKSPGWRSRNFLSKTLTPFATLCLIIHFEHILTWLLYCSTPSGGGLFFGMTFVTITELCFEF